MVTPYLVFNGNCKKAMEFYKNVFQCEEPRILPYGDYVPEGIEMPPEGLSNWVMHAEMTVCGTNFWFADEVQNAARGSTVRLTVTVPDAENGRTYFARLKEGGLVTLPPTETFYSTFHAAVTDFYGINWNIVAEEAPKQA